MFKFKYFSKFIFFKFKLLQKHGFGEFYWSDGRYYKGQWVDGK
jgi:hypothetical protein